MPEQIVPPHLKAAFSQYLAAEQVRSTREICLLASVLYTLFGILDLWAIPSALQTVWLIRALVVAHLMLILWCTRLPFFLEHYLPLTVGMYWVMGLGIECMVYLSGDNDLARYLYYTGLILVVMALYTWSFLSVWKNAAIGLALVGLYIFIALQFQRMGTHTEWPLLLTNCFFFVSANVIGVFSNIQRDRYFRENFLLRQNLLTDLQQTQALKTQSQYWAEHDPLTGMANRMYLMRRLKDAMDMAKPSGITLALLFMDLDGFKAINDQWGHAMGDTVLKVVAMRLARCMREGDLLARIGGDEFVAVLEVKPDNRQAATSLATLIVASIESPIRELDMERALSVSIGIAFFPGHAQDADSFLNAADEQMYAAKRQNRGAIRVAPDPLPL